MPTITALNVYPIKSCRGIALTEALITPTGLAHDRHWLVTDETGAFLTQRVLPRMALVQVELGAHALRLAAPGMGPLSLPLDAPGERRPVTIWRDSCTGIDQGDIAAGWLSDFLQRRVRLVRFDFSRPRLSDPHWAGDSGATTAFADGYAVLVASDASLADLNARLPGPLPMNRFRPNIVIDGIEAFDEDHIAALRVGGAALRLVKPCTRCVVTTTDQSTAERAPDNEPLATLAGYRRKEEVDGVCFAMNAIVARADERPVRVGDEVEIEWSF
ncbi:MAG TPA: MOSC N-terminal beta barrel domain-containing protein [Pelomicrobium sp.]|nr:MOSC N-terminal beta barrel domain-containing protein [Pelomicrobium sp.]